MAVIVVDTNILVASPLLESRAWRSLTDHAAEWDIEVVVPEVVVMETVNVVQRGWASSRQKVVDLNLGVFGLDDAKAAIVSRIDEVSSAYEMSLRTRLNAMGVKVWPTPAIDYMDIARRASGSRAPYGGGDKDGFRDTLVWHSVLAAAQANPETEVWLVSDNHTDFGPKAGNWTSDGKGTRDACPILFHKELVAELTERRLSERVFYVLSLNRIEQHFASQFSPIDAETLERLVDILDDDALDNKLIEVLAGLVLDPDQAALPLEVQVAEVAGAREEVGGWIFTEGARRGDAGWTGRFSVDAEVDIAALDTQFAGHEYTKELRLSGQVRVSPSGEVLEMTVDSAVALPGDPMRARRDRRAERHSVDPPLSGIAGLVGVHSNETAETMRKILFSGSPSIVEALNAQANETAETMRKTLFSGSPSAAEMISRQANETAETMRKILFSGSPNIVEALNAQANETAETMRRVLFGGKPSTAEMIGASRDADPGNGDSDLGEDADALDNGGPVASP
ncbi:PIN domain-containing protein [Mycobacterium sp. AZCC_0083]|uniref:PIN domain-containing protein n=1 Tax=Mycobacterium sp. AZCC_0083 TaxID=2735882 RepID=UPI001622AC50|nr:PIN domain-containing protein [Mycobacterium sp. AZCC_0083]MBB5161585.1 putative nucleic-acid-binding protein [Mycobacterium sp. AZCC_0083]